MKKIVLFMMLVFVGSISAERSSGQSQQEGSKSQGTESSSLSGDESLRNNTGELTKSRSLFSASPLQPSGKLRFGLLFPVEGFLIATSALRNSDTRWLVDAGIGTAAGLGFKLPDTNYDLALEKPIRSRFEYQASLGYSPSKKLITGDGNSFLASTQGLFWVRHNVALIGGYRYSKLWTSQFIKSGSYRLVGVAIREYSDKFGPGRTYITYEFPTGCVLATPSNPCTIQSNRLQGFNVSQEFHTTSHLRIAAQYGIYHFCDQGNPFAPNVPRSCHMTFTSQLVFRIAIRAHDQDTVY
jgi:hypothetical protein